ncbi:glycosyltransferase [Hazenella sp. IB182357]|uniref:Glycosyltransferase n=1 Tax=Polycladospora coralii TaxID=2771432 RepID=A0A926N8T4_9BACL|nr:bifunctional glycosyltransferase family 2 protein/class I SAM-dependent methyltransferase [Polycladospora coralii]MBD1372246.1 glycosyltransferase [Polycladospora coralii]
MKTSIIILTLNRLDLTKQCLNSIFTHTKPDQIELIIVDNGSTDGTIEYLKQIQSVKLIQNQENVGFAKGCNQGASYAHGDYILFLNNDTIVSDGWLDAMLALLAQDEQIGMVGPVSNYVSGRQQIPVSYDKIENISDFAEQHCKSHRGHSKQVMRLVGFCLLVRNYIFNEIGGFDERFRLGSFEDDDLCLRVSQLGYQLHIAIDSFVHHHGHATFNSKPDLSIQNLFVENRLRFIEKWGHKALHFFHPRTDVIQFVPPSAQKILEIGCKTGTTGIELKQRQNCSLYGVEPDEIAAQIARHEYDEVHQHALEQTLPYPDGYFDVILLIDVLQRVVNPSSFVQKHAQLLKPSGYLICVLPNFSHAESIIPLLKGEWKYTLEGIRDFEHIRIFTPETSLALFPSKDFIIETQHFQLLNPPQNEVQFLEEVTEIAQKHGIELGNLPQRAKIYQTFLTIKKR